MTSNMSSKNEDVDILEVKIKEKIAEMESPSYEFPKRFGKKEYIAVAVVAAVCLALILWGATF